MTRATNDQARADHQDDSLGARGRAGGGHRRALRERPRRRHQPVGRGPLGSLDRVRRDGRRRPGRRRLRRWPPPSTSSASSATGASPARPSSRPSSATPPSPSACCTTSACPGTSGTRWSTRSTHSVLFEVAMCVMLYLTVLALEFSPVVLEHPWFDRPLFRTAHHLRQAGDDPAGHRRASCSRRCTSPRWDRSSSSRPTGSTRCGTARSSRCCSSSRRWRSG